jgi:hypothetical protein
MGPSFVDNVINIIKTIGIGYLWFMAASAVALFFVCLYERRYFKKEEVLSPSPLQDTIDLTVPVREDRIVNRLGVNTSRPDNLCSLIHRDASDFSDVPYFHAN